MDLFFFFQAEDGIRDLVRSRGLGDVYKRQGKITINGKDIQQFFGRETSIMICKQPLHLTNHVAVSYTHLTLPTSDLV